MANDEHLHILKQGVEAWDKWRQDNSDVRPNFSQAVLRSTHLHRASLKDANFMGAELSGADLGGADLVSANLSGANLSEANLIGADLSETDLIGATLIGANLTGATIRGANLRDANLSRARLSRVDLRRAQLRDTILSEAYLDEANLSAAYLIGANLKGATLTETNLSAAYLKGANFYNSIAGRTGFDNVDLRAVKGLEDIKHLGPSEVSISTIYLSEGHIPEIFLRGCGVPDDFIVQIPALVGSLQPLQFHSCFISYSGRDEEFAKRLHERMRRAQLRVWFAPEDMKGGEKLYEQINRAIQVHDRLLLVLSENSLRSKWVETEIRRARKVELLEERRKLFPIRLVSYEALRDWTCIDSATGENLAEEVRSYYIPDFSNWKNHDEMEQAFARLLSDLKASA